MSTELQDNLAFAQEEYLIDLTGNTAEDVETFISYIEQLNHEGYTINQALDIADSNLGIDFTHVDWRAE